MSHNYRGHNGTQVVSLYKTYRPIDISTTAKSAVSAVRGLFRLELANPPTVPRTHPCPAR
jgi:hypothetical protein